MNAVKERRYPAVPKPKPFKQDAEYLRLKGFAKALETVSGDGREVGGTGLTRLKFEGSPLARLADRGSIGTEELRAAEDIYTAFMAISGALMSKSQRLERGDKSNSQYEPYGVIDAVTRYQSWSKHWSARAKRGDRTLEIVIAVVMVETTLRVLERAHGLQNGKAATIVGSALRDYAARAGWTTSADAHRYMQAAESNFCLRREKTA